MPTELEKKKKKTRKGRKKENIASLQEGNKETSESVEVVNEQKFAFSDCACLVDSLKFSFHSCHKVFLCKYDENKWYQVFQHVLVDCNWARWYIWQHFPEAKRSLSYNKYATDDNSFCFGHHGH